MKNNPTSKLRQALSDLTSAEADLRNRHAALVRERDAVAKASPDRDTLVANARTCVAARGAALRDRVTSTLVSNLAGGRVKEPGQAERLRPPSLPTFPPDVDHVEVLAAFFPEKLEAFLVDAIDARGSFGLNAADRAAKLATLTADIDAIETEHTSLVESSASAGFKLELLTTVRARNEAEARKASADYRGVVTSPSVGGGAA